MSSASLESRVAALEARYTELLKMLPLSPPNGAWRQVVGMFADDPEIEAIHQSAREIREVDRMSLRDQGAP